MPADKHSGNARGDWHRLDSPIREHGMGTMVVGWGEGDGGRGGDELGRPLYSGQTLCSRGFC